MADINLTTTAATTTPTTITTLRTRLRTELHDEDATAYRWTNAVLDRHLSRAARELSLVLPREQKTALTTTAGSRDLDVTSLADLIRIDAVEYPTGQWPPSFQQFSLYQTTLTLHTDGTPSAAQAVNVYWSRLHTLDASASTLPPAAEDVVLTGAAAYAALEWASFATNRANVAGSDAFEDYRAWGEERLRQFRDALSRIGREARIRQAALYPPGQPSSRNSVQWPA